MKLSIIIPYFNAEDFILDLLNVLVCQGFDRSEYEILIIDDGSTHDTSCLLTYIEKHKEIRYFRQENGGVSVARNKGIQEAKGEYLFFCDADDLVAEKTLREVYQIAHDKNLDAIFYNRIVMKDGKRIYGPHPLASYPNEVVCSGKDFYATHPRFTLGPCFFYVRRELVVVNQIGFPVGMKFAEDISFVLDVLCLSERVMKIDRDVYYYIMRDDSVTHFADNNKKIKRREDFMKVIDKELGIIGNEANQGFINSIKNLMFGHCFDLLFDSFNNLPPHESKICIRKLQSLKLYPFPYGEYYRQDALKKHVRLHWLMNHYKLWMICCYLMSFKRKISKK